MSDHIFGQTLHAEMPRIPALRAARSMLEGRQLDPGKQLSGQINDSHPTLEQGTESGLQACSFF